MPMLKLDTKKKSQLNNFVEPATARGKVRTDEEQLKYLRGKSVSFR